MQVYKDENEEEVKASTNLWPHALRTAEAGKVTSFTLRQAGDSIRETTRWTDPVDSLSVYAYIAKAQANEAFVEDKHKREDEAPKTSKRQTQANTRSDGERMQKLTPIPEVQMEDASKDKKQSKVCGPSYKLRSDIELATNLKKVFEERILNSKVEMTLGDIVGIAKREFHEEIIDIIKRKQHVPMEQETNPTNNQNILHEELEDLEEPRARMENDKESPKIDVDLPHLQVGGLVKDKAEAHALPVDATAAESAQLMLEYPLGLKSVIVPYVGPKEQLVDMPPKHATFEAIPEVEISQFSTVVVDGDEFIFLHNLEKQPSLEWMNV
ncbi:hypothetical protein L7F22_000534 [Adiantum nelumboides]|nr:hypothetical protein [Adiantum nelumboides]